MEISFCDLRAKEVVNLFDGKQLGHIIDIIIDTSCSRVLGLVLPCEKNLFSFFKSSGNIFVPYNRICKIGKDVILVDLNIGNQQNIRILEESNKNNQKKQSPHFSKSTAPNQEYKPNRETSENNFENLNGYNEKVVYDYYDEINRNKRKEEY